MPKYIAAVWHRAPVERAMEAPFWRTIVKHTAESPEHFKQIVQKQFEGDEIEIGTIGEPWGKQ